MTAKQNHVAWHKLAEYETKVNKKTECRRSDKRVLFKRYAYLDSIKKYVAWKFLYKTALRVAHSRKLSAKNTKWKFMQIIYAQSWFTYDSALSKGIIRSPFSISPVLFMTHYFVSSYCCCILVLWYTFSIHVFSCVIPTCHMTTIFILSPTMYVLSTIPASLNCAWV